MAKKMCLEFSCKREQSSLLELPSAAKNLKEETLRQRTCTYYISTGVLPSRQNHCYSLPRGLRPRLSSLRSVLPSRQLIRSAYSCGLFNLCVEVVFVMQMQIYNFVPIKCAYTENFKAAIFCFQGDIFSFLLESFHYPMRKFLLQSL